MHCSIPSDAFAARHVAHLSEHSTNWIGHNLFSPLLLLPRPLSLYCLLAPYHGQVYPRSWLRPLHLVKQRRDLLWHGRLLVTIPLFSTPSVSPQAYVAILITDGHLGEPPAHGLCQSRTWPLVTTHRPTSLQAILVPLCPFQELPLVSTTASVRTLRTGGRNVSSNLLSLQGISLFPAVPLRAVRPCRTARIHRRLVVAGRSPNGLKDPT